MNQWALLHEPKSKMAYAYDNHSLHIRFRSAKDDLAKIEAIAFDPYNWLPDDQGAWHFDISRQFILPMVKEHSDDLFDYWFVEVNQIDSLRIRYGFLLHGEEEAMFYGPNLKCDLITFESIRNDGNRFFNFPFINQEDVYVAPDWVENTVWYQIYPERFCNGLGTKKTENQLQWAEYDVVTNEMFFGGDIEGVIQKLDDLVDLGINGIYFTPIFESPSSHKYDTTDYFKIDPVFGSNEDLKRMVKEAHSRGIKVMLDGVFNHCGFYHKFWQDVVEKGSESQYYDCFFVEGNQVYPDNVSVVYDHNRTKHIIESMNYRAFGYAPMMPKWNTANPIARKHLLEVAKFWIETCDIDGWRLDVSNEVSHDFWRDFRKIVKKAKPDAYIIGENWDASYPWMAGDQFDAVMNYEFLNIVWNLIGVESEIREKTTIDTFIKQLGNYWIQYPKNVVKHMFNMMDSHDTARVMTVCGGNQQKAKLVYLLQFIMPGSPSILYGSEIGLEGTFESARACMIFDEDTDHHPIRVYLKILIHLRHHHQVFKSLDYLIKDVDHDHQRFTLEKTFEKDQLSVYFDVNEIRARVILNDELVLEI